MATDHPDNRRSGALAKWRGGGLLIAIAVVSGITTVWALADPQDDPVAQGLAVVQTQFRDLVAWYERGPVDATPDWAAMRLQVLNGDADRGRAAMVTYGCGSCHVIPRVAGAHGTVGPPLLNFADRAYIAGVLPNRPGDLTRWLLNPPLYAPDTAMPDLDVTETDATDMAAFLYTLGADG